MNIILKKFFKKLKRFVSNEEKEELKFLKFEELYKNFQNYEKFRRKDPLEEIWEKHKENFKSTFFYYDMYNNEKTENFENDLSDNIDDFLKNKQSAEKFIRKIKTQKKNFSEIQNKVDSIIKNLKENDFSKRLNEDKIDSKDNKFLSQSKHNFSQKSKIQEEEVKKNFGEELSKLDEEFNDPIVENKKISSSFKKNYMIKKSSRKKKSSIKIKNKMKKSIDKFGFFS